MRIEELYKDSYDIQEDEKWLKKLLNAIFTTSNQFDTIDEEYVNHSGYKNLIRRLNIYFNKKGGSDDAREALRTLISKLCSSEYSEKWKKVKEALEIEYNMIENYDRTEDTTRTNTSDNTRTLNEKINRTIDGTTTNDNTNQISGFDSSDYSDNTKETNSETNTSNEDHTNDTTETNTGSNDETTTSHIHGNIGVTTSQQMLESEMVYRTKYILNLMIFRDIDSLIAVNVYDNLNDLDEYDY